MDSTKINVEFRLNGRDMTSSVRPDLPLITLLHEDQNLTGTKLGCGIGECKACTVAVRHSNGGPLRAVQACVTPMRNVSGWDVTTVEGIRGDAEGRLHALQERFLTKFAFQCGYCTPGFLSAGVALLDQFSHSPPTPETIESRIEEVIGRNLCRCTSYHRYYEAIAEVAFDAGFVKGDCEASPKQPDVQGPNLSRGRVFDSSLLELIRLLRVASEIEHSLMLQYLYAALAIRTPRYAELAGWGNHQYAGRPLNLLGVAIEEMGHLHVVNRLLIALSATPTLGRQQFPFESDLYPFQLNLEPLSLRSLARYTYVEAPANMLDPQQAPNDDHRKFLLRLEEVLGRDVRPNRIQPLYLRIDELLVDLERVSPATLKDLQRWRTAIAAVRHEGEIEHFELFKDIFMGRHPAFSGVQNPWGLPPSDSDFPSLSVACNPSAFNQSGSQITSFSYRQVAWLGNIHYWVVCMLLDLSYRDGDTLLLTARRHMTGPIRSLGSFLAQAGVGMPFDSLNMGYSFGIDRASNRHHVRELLGEIDRLEHAIAGDLPDDYPVGICKLTSNDLFADELRFSES